MQPAVIVVGNRSGGPGRSSLNPFSPSACKGNSANFAFRGFSEVPLTLESFWVGASPARERKRSAPFLVPY
jgi:hypothetical protein